MTVRKAKPGSDANVCSERRDDHIFEPILQTLHGLFRRDYPKQVGRLTERHKRTVAFWKKGTRMPDGGAVMRLITGPFGEVILEAILKTVSHRWAEEWLDGLEIARAGRVKAAADERLKRAMRKVDA